MVDITETKNAIIKSATISNSEHGCLIAWITLDYGSSCQTFGGYSLYFPSICVQSNYAGHFIWKVLEIADVSEWSKLQGKTIRVKASNCKVYEIGHIIKNIWFNPSHDFEAMEKNRKII
jgi:hypothetical protein